MFVEKSTVMAEVREGTLFTFITAKHQIHLNVSVEGSGTIMVLTNWVTDHDQLSEKNISGLIYIHVYTT